MATAQLPASTQAIRRIAAALSDERRPPSRRGATDRLTAAARRASCTWPYITATADFSASQIPPRGAGVA